MPHVSDAFPALIAPLDQMEIWNAVMNRGERKNLLVNGDFSIWQRGNDTGSFTGGRRFGPDRWYAHRLGNAGNLRVSRQAGLTAKDAARIERPAGDANTATVYFVQQIESAVLRQYAGRKVTMQFNYRTGANYSGGNVICEVYNGTGTDESFFSLGTFTGLNLAATFNSAASVAQVAREFTFTLPANATEAFVRWSWVPAGAAGANDWVEFEIAQKEVGNKATRFAAPDRAAELILCQREFEKSYDTDTAPGSVTNTGAETFHVWAANNFAHGGKTPFKVTKRAVPSILIYNPVTGATGSGRNLTAATNPAMTVDAQFTGQSGFRANINNVAAAAADQICFHWTAENAL